MSGEVKVFNGSVFNWKPVKVWNGSSWVTKSVKYWNGATWVTTNSGASPVTISAPEIAFPSPKNSNPTSIAVSLPADWIAGADALKVAISASSAMTSPTIIRYPSTPGTYLSDADAAAGTLTIGIPTLTPGTPAYIQAYGEHVGSDSLFKSNIVAFGDAAGPAITTASTTHISESFTLALALTYTDTGGSGVPAAVSAIRADGTRMPGWYIYGGDDRLQAEAAVVSGSPQIRWYGNGTKSFANPDDVGKNNTYDVIAAAVDYAGNTTTKALQIIVDQADTTVDAFDLGGPLTGQTRGATFTTNTVNVSGLSTGVGASFTVTGGTVHGTINGSSVSGLTSGTVKNGDALIGDGTNSASYETTTVITLDINGVSSTFSSTTLADPANVPFTLGTTSTKTGQTTSSTFTGQTFAVSGSPSSALGLLFINSSSRQVGGVTVGGVAATLVKDSGGSTSLFHSSIWKAHLTDFTAKSVVISSIDSGSLGNVDLTTATLQTGNETETGTAGLTGTGGTTLTSSPALTCPANGIIVAVGISAASSGTWASPMNSSATLMDGVPRQHMVGVSRSSTTVTINNSGGGGAIAAAAWNP